MSLSLKRLKGLLASCKGRNIAVVGDLMLDVYLFGGASRLSQEAPVPVVRVKSRSARLGGAANVMRNVAALGGKVCAFGLVGDDEAGSALRELLRKDGVDAKNVLTDETRRTTEKQRILAGSQQLARMDFEDTHPAPPKILDRMSASLSSLIKRRAIDAIIFEDYAKGSLERELIQSVADDARRAGIITSLDPHPGHQMEARRLSLMTPNRSEAFGLAGMYCHDAVSPVEKDSRLMAAAAKLMEQWEPDSLLVTLGSQGMALFEGSKPVLSIPTKAREVFDVSGAGDTVIAAYTLALAAGAKHPEAAQVANHAAGVVVGKVGTATCSPEELLQSFKLDS